MIVIRSCKEDMTSYNHFKWKTKGIVVPESWRDTACCGYGLHGLRPGDTDPGIWYKNGKYLALEVDESTIVSLGNKCKFPRAKVLHVSNSMEELSIWLQSKGYNGPWYHGVVTSEDYGTSISGSFGKSTSGFAGKSISGSYGTSISGNSGISISSYRGTSITGDGGRSISEEYGNSISGERGVSISGIKGQCKSGKNGRIEIEYNVGSCRKKVIGYIGKDGLEPDVFYKVKKGKLERSNPKRNKK